MHQKISISIFEIKLSIKLKVTKRRSNPVFSTSSISLPPGCEEAGTENPASRSQEAEDAARFTEDWMKYNGGAYYLQVNLTLY